MEFKEAKRVVRAYLRSAYTDRYLVLALDYARAGKLEYYSCCCFAGIPNAMHEGGKLRNDLERTWTHHVLNCQEELDASNAYCCLRLDGPSTRTEDPARRRILIPMILAEIRRRTRSREPEPCQMCQEKIR